MQSVGRLIGRSYSCAHCSIYHSLTECVPLHFFETSRMNNTSTIVSTSSYANPIFEWLNQFDAFFADLPEWLFLEISRVRTDDKYTAKLITSNACLLWQVPFYCRMESCSLSNLDIISERIQSTTEKFISSEQMIRGTQLSNRRSIFD